MTRYIIGQTLACDGGQGAIMPLTRDFREPRKQQWGAGTCQAFSKGGLFDSTTGRLSLIGPEPGC